MISCSLDAFIIALRKAAEKAGEGLTVRRKDEAPAASEVPAECDEMPSLCELFAPLNMKVSRMCMEIPVWIDRRLISGRVCFRIGRKSLWSGDRGHKLCIQLDGDALSHVTVCFDGRVFRSEGENAQGAGL